MNQFGFRKKKIADLFGVQCPVTKHLKNIFESGELDEKMVCSALELPSQYGAVKLAENEFEKFKQI